MRRSPTGGEVVLWHNVRSRRLRGLEFRRQHEIGPFIVDFYCEEVKLAVEIDGAPHFEPEGRAYDARRTAWLKQHGVTVIHFENNDPVVNPGRMLEQIGRVVDKLRDGHPA